MSAIASTPPAPLPGHPWHEGEMRMQRSVGGAERMSEVGARVIRDHLLEQHRNFYPQLPFVVLGAVDAEGDAWASLRAGEPGFLQSSDPLTLRVVLPREITDPADAGLNDGNTIGLLGIELHTRRRNRLNGSIHRRGSNALDIDVRQSFGNCPKYISPRDFAFTRAPSDSPNAAPVITDRLDAAMAAMISVADTFFVASYVGNGDDRQVDVSHRGGASGFVHVDTDGGLTIPDYAGNRFFNTLGNLLANPKAGLTFVDFATGALLQLSGDAEVMLDGSDIAAFPDAERLWRFHPRRIVFRADALPLRWT